MDAKRIKELDVLCEAASDVAAIRLNPDEARELIDAYKSLSRITSLPKGWKEKAELYARSKRHGAQVGANMAERCADELETAISK